ncbi:MAG: hypothetical protein ABEK03_07505 [Candidatus Bipolaricaulia bacterium]
MIARKSVVALLTIALLALGTWPAFGQDASTQTPSTEAGNPDIARTLEALRTLLQNTESRLEQTETRLDAQGERTSQLQSQVNDLQERVEGQLSILSEQIADQGARINRLQTASILVAVVLVAVIAVGLIRHSRRLSALEALHDHVDRGVEQDDAEEPSQE